MLMLWERVRDKSIEVGRSVELEKKREECSGRIRLSEARVCTPRDREGGGR